MAHDPGYPQNGLCALLASSSHSLLPERAIVRRVLVVDQRSDARDELQHLLIAEGCQVATAEDGLAAVDALDACDVVFCTVHELAALSEREPLIVVTVPRAAFREGLLAVERGAAVDCLLLPAKREEVALALGRVARFEELRRRSEPERSAEPGRAGARGRASKSSERPQGLGGMVGASACMQELFETIEKVARHKAAVLITGESGTGKELVARAIHDLSPRKSQSFVAINCGAIPANLLESELFGYRRGAFTDAVRDKAGLFEVADGGTLFLDEVGELPLNLQVKLLRALQEEEIRRIGDNKTTKVDVRIIAATLRNLTDDVANGRFREDLFYRLNVLPIVLPALRERREDIRPLAEHFVAVYRQRQRGAASQAESISEEAMAMLETYDWPGNIRELENTIERAMVLADGPRIEAHLLDGKLAQRPQVAARAATVERESAALDDKDLSIKKHTRRIEEELIRRALEKAAGNRHNASKLLGISYRALLYKIKEFGI
jgi:two-component system response regulator AtoC